MENKVELTDAQLGLLMVAKIPEIRECTNEPHGGSCGVFKNLLKLLKISVFMSLKDTIQNESNVI